jgi:hypothetical protein
MSCVPRNRSDTPPASALQLDEISDQRLSLPSRTGEGCGHSGDKRNIFRQLLDFDPDGSALCKPDPGVDGIDIRRSLRAWGRVPQSLCPV